MFFNIACQALLDLTVEKIWLFLRFDIMKFLKYLIKTIIKVTTEYLVWLDDDFFINNGTDLNQMIEILENTDLDIVGGKAGASRFISFYLLTRCRETFS